MRTTNILHISDLHFTPTLETGVGDLKDNEISNFLGCEISAPGCRNRFITEAKRLFENIYVNIDIIACTGDLGFKGEELGLELGIKYLAKLSKDLQVPSSQVIISPGNHDLKQKEKFSKALDMFCNNCEEEGFIYAKHVEPAFLTINNIPFIALNSCLGGTEHALHGLPKDFWEKEKDMLIQKESEYDIDELIKQVESDVKYQLKAMDIPALGFKQLDFCIEKLAQREGNCAVILIHHNPVPTGNVDIRPYANMIDSGPFILRLMVNGRHIILLHGHAHAMSGLTVYPHQGDEGGFLASIGNRGLSGGINSEASLIQITTTDRNDFIKANVYSIERNADIFQNSFKYSLTTRSVESPYEDFELNKLPKNRSLSFQEVSEMLGKKPDESLAEKLVILEPMWVKITSQGYPSRDNWRIIRVR